MGVLVVAGFVLPPPPSFSYLLANHCVHESIVLYAAISAPSFNPQDFDGATKKVFDKKDEERVRIKDILSRNLLFKNCQSEQMESLVDAFQPMNFDDGAIIIAQGDPVGEHFYLLEEGAADVYVSSKGEEHKVLAYESGSGAAFGELSLMYNAPRAATVKAKGATKAYCMNRL